MSVGAGPVGRHVERVDVRDKLTGRARFTGDLSLPGMLHGALVTSTYPKGRIRRVDAGPALALDGVVTVVTGRDLPALGCREPRHGVVVRDRPVLPDDCVRFVGEPVAVVVARDRRTARRAAGLVEVEIEAEPATTTLEQALAEGAPLVHFEQYEPAGSLYSAPAPMVFGRSNDVMTYQVTHGDLEAELAAADEVVEETYTFPGVYHYAIEPFCVLAQADDASITVWSSAQHPHQVAGDLARIWGRPLSRVRVLVEYVGGGFGSKSFTHVEPVAVAAALAARAPVRLELDIAQSMAVSRRHGMRARMRMGLDRRGDIRAVDAELFYDGGAYALLGPYVAAKGAFRALGGYRFGAYRVRSHLVYTNTSPAGSFRAIGGPQAAWALESHIDRLAARLGIEPLEYRRRLVAGRGEDFRPGRTPLDADLEMDLAELSEATAALAGIQPPDDRWRTGSGAALGVSDPGATPVSSAIVRLLSDGSVGVMIGSSELGQGVRTVVAQIVAESLGVALDAVTVYPTDTGAGPYDASTGASRSTTMSGLAAQRAALAVRERLAGHVAATRVCPVASLEFASGSVRVPDGGELSLGSLVHELFGQRGGNVIGVGEVTGHEFPTTPPFWEVSAGAATVAVDTGTGEVRVLGYASVSDVGKAVNPRSMEGQEAGAVAQGLGHTLFEEMVWDDGQPVTDSLVTYRVPRAGDVPVRFASRLVENQDGPGAFGLKGAGEGPILPVSGAVAAALWQACGVRLADLPLTPERVWRALVAAGLSPDHTTGHRPSQEPGR